MELGELIGSSNFGGFSEEGVVGFDDEVLRMGMLELLWGVFEATPFVARGILVLEFGSERV